MTRLTKVLEWLILISLIALVVVGTQVWGHDPAAEPATKSATEIAVVTPSVASTATPTNEAVVPLPGITLTPTHQVEDITPTFTPRSRISPQENMHFEKQESSSDDRGSREQLLDPEYTLPTPTPPPIIYPETAYPTRLVIPAIDLDAPVVGVVPKWETVRGESQLSWEAPDLLAVGWHLDSVPLGFSGNTVLNGHNNIFGGVFRKLDRVNLGDVVMVYANATPYYYRITQKYIIKEAGQPLEVRLENAKWVQRTIDERLTLLTCWPITSNTHRLIVVAEPFAPTPTPLPDFH